MSPAAHLDDALVRDARSRLSAAPDLLQRHSLRMAALADDLADRENLAVDRVGLFCACAFHDLGLLVGGSMPFPVRSAGLLEAFLAEHDVPPLRAKPLVRAVSRHLLPPVPLLVRDADPSEMGVLRRAAWLDALAFGDREARCKRSLLRSADADPVLDVRLNALLGAACARDVVAGAVGIVRRLRRE